MTALLAVLVYCHILNCTVLALVTELSVTVIYVIGTCVAVPHETLNSSKKYNEQRATVYCETETRCMWRYIKNKPRYMSLSECRLLSLCLVLINDLQSHCWCRVCCVVHGVGISPVDEILRKDLQQVRTRER